MLKIKSEGYLIDNNNKLLNKFELHYLLSKKQNLKIGDLNKNKFLKLYSDTDIFESIEKAKNFVGESIPIINSKNEMRGVISEADLFHTFLKVIKEEKELENKD